MSASKLIRTAAAVILSAIAMIAVYRLGQRIALYGGVSSYLESREKMESLKEAIDLINAYYVDGAVLDEDKLTEDALKGMLSDLDPYSQYMAPEALKQLQEITAQEFGGLGIQVEMRDDRLTIVTPIEGTPGEHAGLLPEDQIVEVDGDSIEGMPMMAAIDLLRGAPGSMVTIGVYRPRTDENFKRTITREIIEVDNVRGAKMLSEEIGYLRILQFGARTGQEVRESVDSLLKQGMKALVIDLRNNPGGLLEAAVDVAKPFFDGKQLIVYTEGRHKMSNDRWYSEFDGEPYRFPLAILVNTGSASASEIIAGVFKDTKRAILVGQKTFGKGSVQNVLQLENGAGLRLTTAKYYTPGGYVIHEKGIEPSILVETDVDEDRKLAIQRSRMDLMDRDEFIERFEFEPIADRQLDAAIEALTSELEISAALPETENDTRG